MTRILVIGNSHVGALKQGWELCADDFPGARVDFFALAGRNFTELQLDRSLRFGLPEDADPASSAYRSVQRINGCSSVELNQADVVVWAGYDWRHAVLAALLDGYDVDGIRESGASSLMSRAAFAAACDALAEALLPPEPWRDWPRPQLFLLPRPVPAESCLTAASGGPKFGHWTRALRNGASFRPALDLFFDALAARLREAGIGLVRPPERTAGATGLTDAVHTHGSTRLRNDEPHPGNDHSHMNGEYGIACLEALFDQIGVRRAPALAGQPATSTA
jgi:hypothetical protein